MLVGLNLLCVAFEEVPHPERHFVPRAGLSRPEDLKALVGLDHHRLVSFVAFIVSLGLDSVVSVSLPYLSCALNRGGSTDANRDAPYDNDP